MSNANRLRAAADQCDAWAADTKAANSALLTSWKIDAATAALLRAVAHHPKWVDDDDCCTGCYAIVAGEYASPHYRYCEWGTALALADAILGVES